MLPVPDSEETINESATSMGDQQPEEAPIKASESTQPSVKSGGSTVGARPESPSLSSGWPTEARVITHAFSGYALKWTGAPNNGNKPSDFNPKYPHYGNNCANFASQVLDNAGWYLTGGNSLQVKDLTKWTFNLAGIAHATRTWSSAGSLFTFANNTKAYEWLSNIWIARPGDLLFVDWDPNGKADGHIDHVMVVTGVTKNGVPRISQKSNSRYNITLSTALALAKQQKKTKIVWFGLKHK